MGGETAIFNYDVIRYFFTFTLSKNLLSRPIKTQLKYSYMPLYVVTRELFNNFEIAYEFTKKGNIHYHGIGELPKDMEHLIVCFQDLMKKDSFGFNNISVITQDNGVSQYISKDLEATARVCKRLKVDTDQYPIYINNTMCLKRIGKLKPLEFVATHQLDITETIDEDEEHFMAYNYQLK